MMLKIVKMPDGKNAVFQNQARIDEREIYDEALSRLKNTAAAKHVYDIMGPSEDVSVWRINADEVRLVLDLSYGAEISTGSEAALDALIQAISD